MLTNWLIPVDWILSKVMHVHGNGDKHEMLPYWVQLSAAVVLIVSIVGGYFYAKIEKKKRMAKVEGITVKVTGMTCSHCDATVKRNLEALNGITNVVADNSSDTVKITGSKINLERVRKTVNSLGYKYVD